MRCQPLLGAIAFAGCLAAGPAAAWDVQTTVVFRNQTGQEANPDMHEEVRNVWIAHGAEWSHTSYYTGIIGRGYHNWVRLRDGRECRISVLIGRNSAGVTCEQDGATADDGLHDCFLGNVERIHEEKRCRFTFVARP